MTSALVVGFDHVSTSSRDVDALTAFYRDNFGIEPAPGFPMVLGDGRKFVMIPLTSGTMLQATEIGLGDAPPVVTPPAPVFYGTARFDHASFRARDAEAFEEIRSRLMASGASDGTIRDFGPSKFFAFRDSDGYLAEVVLSGDGG